ncbi:MAG: hydantoinase B/oxoprolinase family protein [Pseudomonadota bacterium]
MSGADAIDTEIIRGALVAAAEEMSVTIWRTSRSSVVREILDYSTCVFDADGFSVAQAARMPVHLNSMASCLRDLVDEHLPLAEWDDGDIVMTNDPYSGGQHLPDVLTFMPVFVDGERVAIAGILVHHQDVGGGAPGSYDAGATEVFQEGICFPPVKVVRRGLRNEDLIKTFLRNTREPENVGGDFESQLAALTVGARALAGLARRYGSERLAAACTRIQAQSEEAMLAAIDAMPDGEFYFEDQVDDDGLGDGPIAIRCQLSVQGQHLAVDLSASADQVSGPVNCTRNMASSAVVCAVLMSIGQEIPANAGCYRAVHIVTRPGSVVHARRPAAVANRMAVGHRVVNCVMGAFAQALPQAVPACYYGVSYAYALQAYCEDGSRPVYFDLECGGWGAHPTADGANGFSCGFHNVANSPVEMIEQDYPITFTAYGLLANSGGPGRYRGGLGLVREFRLDAPSGKFAANLDRFKIPPYGLAGGGAGRPGRLFLKSADGTVTELGSKVRGIAVERGDSLRLETAGGGGHGDPALREPDAVTRDLVAGYVTEGD